MGDLAPVAAYLSRTSRHPGFGGTLAAAAQPHTLSAEQLPAATGTLPVLIPAYQTVPDNPVFLSRRSAGARHGGCAAWEASGFQFLCIDIF